MEESRGYVAFRKFNGALLKKYQEDPNIGMHDLYTFILDWADKENK
jgi:hypothetical protein